MNKTIAVQRWVTITGLILLILKFFAYYLTHSVSILTDALESIVNVVAGFITLYSLYIAAKPRDADHPYGHGKAEFLSSAVEGALIFVAGIFIVVEAINNLLHPKEINELDIGILIIAFSGIINLIAGLIAVKTGKKNNSIAIGATGKHLISDAISTAGLIVGLLLIYFTKAKWIDSGVALLMSVIIMYTGVQIVRKSIAGIMDEADAEILQRMVNVLNKYRRPKWIDLHNLRFIKYGNGLHLDCHLTLPWYLNMHEAHAELDELAKVVRNEFDDSLELFVHTDGCMPFSCPLCTVENCNVRLHKFEKIIEWTIDNVFQNEKHTLTIA